MGIQWKHLDSNLTSSIGRFLNNAIPEIPQFNTLREDPMPNITPQPVPEVAQVQQLEQPQIQSQPLVQSGNIGNLSGNQQAFYDSLVKGGMSHNQALAVMMNVHAENNFADKYLFGTHQDGGKRAYGALSWQGGRELPLLAKLEANGLLKNGQILNDPRTMAIQAQHFLEEYNGAEKANAHWFRENPNADPYELARYLNKKVIRSNQSKKVLEGREKNYRAFMNKFGGNNG